MSVSYKVRAVFHNFLCVEEVEMWNIFYNYFTFKLQEPDEGSEFFHIVNLAQQNAEILVSDFTQFDGSRKDDQCKW
jgi:hypothetical protein